MSSQGAVSESSPPKKCRIDANPRHEICVEARETFTFLWALKDLIDCPIALGTTVQCCEFKTNENSKIEWVLKLKHRKSFLDFSMGVASCDKNVLASIKVCVIDTEFRKKCEVSGSRFFVRNFYGSDPLTFHKFLEFDEVVKTNKYLHSNDLILYGEVVIFNNDVEQSLLSVPDDSCYLENINMLYHSSLYSDLVVDVQGRKFPCHKAVLSCRSDIFDIQETDIKDQSDSAVVVDNLDPNVFKQLLQYVYTDKIDICEENVIDLLAVAEKYSLSNLKLLCEAKLHSYFNFINTYKMLIISDRFQLPKLKLEALHVLGMLTKQFQVNLGCDLLRSYGCLKKVSDLEDQNDSGSSLENIDLTLQKVEPHTFLPPADVWCFTDNHVFLRTRWRVKRFSDLIEGKGTTAHVFTNEEFKISCKMELFVYKYEDFCAPRGCNITVHNVKLYFTLVSSKEKIVCIEFCFTVLDSSNREAYQESSCHFIRVGESLEVMKINVKDLKGKNMLPDGDLVINCKCFIRNSSVWCYEQPLLNSNLISDFSTLYNEDQHKDLTIRVRDKEFLCHRAIIACRSPFFARELKSYPGGQAVELDDVEPDLFEKILSYIYTDQYESLESDAKALLPFASKFELKHLKTLCEKCLIMDLSLENALETLTYSISNSASLLQSNTLRFISKYWTEILESSVALNQIKDYDLLADILDARCQNDDTLDDD